MKVTVITFSILAALTASVFFYMQPAGPPPHPTMISFMESVKNQNHEEATLYFLTPHNRDVYRKTYLEQDKLDESNESIQVGFEGDWPTYSDIHKDPADPREWIESERKTLDFMAKNYRINWSGMHLKECREIYQSRHTLKCEYSNKAWYKPTNRYHNSYRLTLSYDYGEDRILSYWIHPQD